MGIIILQFSDRCESSLLLPTVIIAEMFLCRLSKLIAINIAMTNVIKMFVNGCTSYNH